MRTPEHAEVLPDHLEPMPVPETRLETLWLLILTDMYCEDDPSTERHPTPDIPTDERNAIDVEASSS